MTTQQKYVNTLRNTHNTVSSLLPLVSASLTVFGLVLAALDGQARPAQQSAAARTLTREGAPEPLAAGASPMGCAFALVQRLLLVLLGGGIVVALIALALGGDATVRIVELTVLILVVLYLAEKVAMRQTQRR